MGKIQRGMRGMTRGKNDRVVKEYVTDDSACAFTYVTYSRARLPPCPTIVSRLTHTRLSQSLSAYSSTTAEQNDTFILNLQPRHIRIRSSGGGAADDAARPICFDEPLRRDR